LRSTKIFQSVLPDAAVELQSLTKLYRARGRQAEKLALDGVSLTIPRGSFFGLLGPNGAGKSTLINILAGLVNKTAGTARIWGFDSVTDERRARSAIGVVPQELNFDPFFTPRELLEVQAGLYGVPPSERRTDQILAALGLSDKAHAYSRSLSGGMRRRLLVAKAMVHRPPVLVLDEPTAGVDIDLRRQLWDYVRDLNRAGTTVLLTTHYLEEAEALCDRIAIIDRGIVVAHDETRCLLAGLDSKILTVTLDRPLSAVPPALAALAPSLAAPQRLVFQYQPSHTEVGEILAALQAAGLGIQDLSTQEADLEDIFLRLTRAGPA
jgi:ABC-2 type transport system ATP-binding protein